MQNLFSRSIAAVLLTGVFFFTGCGGADQEFNAPEGNELTEFLANNPEINEATYESEPVE
tara:strand:- start:14047 stop:14226 length:180 start_codon:yes stop_codon:yes gene_type:complete